MADVIDYQDFRRIHPRCHRCANLYSEVELITVRRHVFRVIIHYQCGCRFLWMWTPDHVHCENPTSPTLVFYRLHKELFYEPDGWNLEELGICKQIFR